MPYNTRDEILKLGELDPELAALLQHIKLPPLDRLTVDDLRRNADQRRAANLQALGPPPAEIKVTDVHDIPTYNGTPIRARIYQPNPIPPTGSPLIVMFHGGGFCLGAPEEEERTCRNFVHAFSAVCIAPSYHLAPIQKFPAAPRSAWDALKWCAANARTYGADPGLGFVLGGISTGANLVAVLTHLARDEGLSPPLTGQYLAVPGLLPPGVVPDKYKHLYLSQEQCKESPIFSQSLADKFMAEYEPDESDPIYYAPFNHPNGHAGLPPAYFQVNGLDLLRDEALIYERVLREECGIRTKMDVYPGLPHGYWSFFTTLKSSDRFREDIIRGTGWLLGKEPKMDNVWVKGTAWMEKADMKPTDMKAVDVRPVNQEPARMKLQEPQVKFAKEAVEGIGPG